MQIATTGFAPFSAILTMVGGCDMTFPVRTDHRTTMQMGRNCGAFILQKGNQPFVATFELAVAELCTRSAAVRLSQVSIWETASPNETKLHFLKKRSKFTLNIPPHPRPRLGINFFPMCVREKEQCHDLSGHLANRVGDRRANVHGGSRQNVMGDLGGTALQLKTVRPMFLAGMA